MDKGWGAEKVRVFYGECREKGVLWVLGHWADGTGKDIYPSYEYLSSCTGKSIRTIRRYIRTLIMRGDLVSWCDLKRSRDSNYYMIPLCAETVAELEQRTGISRRQLRLPLVTEIRRVNPIQNDVDRAEHLAKIGVKKWTTPRATVTLALGHGDPVSEEADILEKKDEKISFRKGNKVDNQKIEQTDPDARLDISREMSMKLVAVLEAVKPDDGLIRNPELRKLSEQAQMDRAIVAAERKAREIIALEVTE